MSLAKENAAQAALAQLSLAAGLYAGPVTGEKTIPTFGTWTPTEGVGAMVEPGERIALVFYRAYLTAADTVIHYDPWWNPATEAQATDRAYRIGQKNPVFVHKLICQGTVEERIHQMQQKKSELADALLADPDERLGQAVGMVHPLGVAGDLGADHAVRIGVALEPVHAADPRRREPLDGERAGARAVVRAGRVEGFRLGVEGHGVLKIFAGNLVWPSRAGNRRGPPGRALTAPSWPPSPRRSGAP